MNPGIALKIANAPGPVTVSVSGLPSGITAQYGAASQTISFSGGQGVAAGSYAATVIAQSGMQTVSQPLRVTVDVVAVVSGNVDTSLGQGGKLSQFMATSFQIFQWTGDIFGAGTTATQREAQLTNLGAQHNRMQVIMGGMPMKSNTGTAADWDFTTLDQTAEPVLASGDHSPEFQIGTAPAWMCDSNGHLLLSHASDFAQYAANLVRYYNKGGFNWGGKHFQAAANHPITLWGVFNEYNINGLSASDYLTLYNTTVPAMLAVDSTIRIAGLELSDWGLGSGGAGDPMVALPTFLSTSNTTGVNTQLDVLATHFYGSCNQTDSDAHVFAQVPLFADNVRYFYQALKSRPDLANVQVWVTENNVNADFNDGTGHSTCNPGHTFVTDRRGTSAYFAAWRPYVFSQLGKAGNRALYHWDYASDQQYGEVDANNTPYLSYWVDRTLANFFPSTSASRSMDILSTTLTDTNDIEVLAARASNGEVHVMVVNRAVHQAGDNNGAGDPRTIVILIPPGFASASVVTVDANTSLTNGPTGTSLSYPSKVPVTLNGYGAAFVTLVP